MMSVNIRALFLVCRFDGYKLIILIIYLTRGPIDFSKITLKRENIL